jgi:hypothetical protein
VHVSDDTDDDTDDDDDNDKDSDDDDDDDTDDDDDDDNDDNDSDGDDDDDWGDIALHGVIRRLIHHLHDLPSSAYLHHLYRLHQVPSCLIVIDDCYCPSVGAQVMLLRNRSKMNHGSSG